MKKIDFVAVDVETALKAKRKTFLEAIWKSTLQDMHRDCSAFGRLPKELKTPELCLVAVQSLYQVRRARTCGSAA